MSISSQVSRVDYTGNGSQSVYSYSFKIFKEADLLVTVRNTTTGVESTLTLTTDYTLSGVGETAGGSLTLVDAGQAWLDGDGDLDTGYVITIRRSPDLVQETDIRNQGAYYPEGIENQFDKHTFIDQKQQDEIDRSIKLPESQPVSGFDPTLPGDFAGQADRALVSNPTGDGFDVGPTTDEIANAQAYAIDADEHKQTAERWANFTAGTVVDVDTGADSGEYSAKEYAQGTQAGTGGSSKDWAIETATDVDSTGEYSAKEHAIGVQTRGLAGGGSAKDWAQYTGGTVDDTESSAKKYANDAATSAAAAATAAAASQWNDVVYKVFGDSPVAIVDGDAGTLFAVDCTAGNVVVNLPSIAVLTLTGPWSIAVKKTDTSSNTITINADGTDVIDGNASLTLTRDNAIATLLPDVDASPDEWTSIVTGEYGITGNVVGDTDTQTLTNKTIDGDNNTITNLAHGAEVDNPTSGVHGVTGSVVGTTDTQDLSGKTFTDAITLEELGATPSTPAAGDKKFYAKNDDKLYTLNDAGEEVEVGAGGGGAGGINYIQNPDFEVNIDNVSTTANITEAQETTDELRGTSSLSLTISSSATTANYASILMDNIDPQDLGKTLWVSFDYSTDANYSSGDVEVVLYDTTGAVEFTVPNSGGELMATGSVSNRSRFSAPIQVGDTNTSIELRLKVLSAPASDSEIIIDNVKVGPDTLVPGSIVTEWESFTPTGTWTSDATTVYSGVKRRVGDTMEYRVDIDFPSGAPTTTGTTLDINLPSGEVIDTTKLLNAQQQTIIGKVSIRDASSSVPNDMDLGVVSYASTTTVRPKFMVDNVTVEAAGVIQHNSPLTFTTGDRITAVWSVPIVGLSSGAMLSTTENLFKTPFVRGKNNGGTVLTADVTNIDFTEVTDEQDLWDGTTFTVPSSGEYLISGNVTTTAAYNGNINAWINGASTETIGVGAGTTRTPINGVLRLTVGDTINIRADSGATLLASVTHNISIKGQPDFSTFSVFGETEYLEVTASTITSTSAADTWTDATGMSLTLTPGEWDIGYDISGLMNWNSGAAIGVAANCAIFDASNTLVSPTVALVYNVMSNVNEQVRFSMSRSTRIVVTTSTTYKLRIRCNVASTSAQFDFEASNITGGLTDPDNHSNFWARRVK